MIPPLFLGVARVTGLGLQILASFMLEGKFLILLSYSYML